MTWLVTGATGLLGANVGLDVPGSIGASRTGRVGQGFAGGVALDLADLHGVREVVTTVRPTVVMHAGAMATHESCSAEPEMAMRVNAIATGELAKAAAEVGASFVYLSTDAVFDGTRGHYSEEDEPSPFSVYGESKLAGERLAWKGHPNPLILRVNFFGWSPSGSRSILEFFVNSLEQGRTVPGYTDFIVTTLYVRHLIALVQELIGIGSSGLLHLASTDARSKADFGAEVARAFAMDPSLIHHRGAAESGASVSRRRDLSLDTTKAQMVLRRSLPTQRDGIEAAYADRERRAELRREDDAGDSPRLVT